MSTPVPGTLVTSTADLTPNGIAGYAKAISAFVGGLLLVLVPFFGEDTQWAKYAAIAIAICQFIAVYAFPVEVKPVRVVEAPGG